MKRILILILAAAMLFTGCGNMVTWLLYPSYDEMVYTRPDISGMENLLDTCCAGIGEAKNADEALEYVFEYYDAYDDFFTNYNLAYIRYCGDLTDLYWDEEYNFCAENTSVPDSGLEKLYRTIAACDLRQALEEAYFGEDFFLSYDGEALWDETFTELSRQEAGLLEQYYAVCNRANDAASAEEFYDRYAGELIAIYRKLVLLRRQIAEYAGYETYPQYAYDYSYSRDYSPEQMMAYYRQIQQTLVPLYLQLDDSCWFAADGYSSQTQTLAYTERAARAMGGQIEEAFRLMRLRGLYDITPSEKKHEISFEVYLTSYGVPFVFLNPTGTDYDKLVLTHEFGHFVNDFVCGGSYAGTDVAEVHSQAMEYLSLLYADGEGLTEYKLADCLSTFVEQAAMGMFEHAVYTMEESLLTEEAILATYRQIGEDFGFDRWQWDPREFVLTTHYFDYPMYIDSYVVSNDVAFQIYQRELEETGAGLEIYRQCLASEESWLLTFAETYGLESPFAEGRLETVVQTLTQSLDLTEEMGAAA